MSDNPKVDRANAQFAKLQRAEDGKKAMSEYEAERAAVRAKTERLRALRLARDAAQGTAQGTAQATGQANTRATADATVSPQLSATAKAPVRRKRKNAKSLASA